MSAHDMHAALGVIVETPAIRAWLEANDPKALEQAQSARRRFMLATPEQRQAARAEISANWDSNECEVDDDAGYSDSENGYWVSAWVFVPEDDDDSDDDDNGGND